MSYYNPPSNNPYQRPPPGNAPPQYGAPPPQQYSQGPYSSGPYGQQQAPQNYGYGAPPAAGQPAYGYGAPPTSQPHYGYSQPPYGQPAPPPSQPPVAAGTSGVDPVAIFRVVDKDNSGMLNADELKLALFNSDGSQYEPETVKLMISMFDRDSNGTISLNEFQALHRYLGDWRRCFERFDSDRSGTIDRSEMKGALAGFGFHVDDQVIDRMVHKFGRKKGDKSAIPAVGPTTVSFDSFIRACVTVKTLSEKFMSLDTDRDGYVMFHYNQFLDTVIGTLP